MPIPYGLQVHGIMERCGYLPVKQERNLLVYVDDLGRKRLTMKGESLLTYEVLCEAEDDRSEEWSCMFSGCFGYPLPDDHMLTLLHTIKALDLRD